MDVQKSFKVEATDGDIGKVDEATYEVGLSYIVVDTGPWIFGRKVVLPAGVIERIDLDNQQIELRLTKDQIKSSRNSLSPRTCDRTSTAPSSGTTTTPTSAGRWPREARRSRPAHDRNDDEGDLPDRRRISPTKAPSALPSDR